jgi:hypothetical protein
VSPAREAREEKAMKIETDQSPVSVKCTPQCTVSQATQEEKTNCPKMEENPVSAPHNGQYRQKNKRKKQEKQEDNENQRQTNVAYPISQP